MTTPDLLAPALVLGLVGFSPAQSAGEPFQEWNRPPFVFHYPAILEADARQIDASGHRVLPGMAEDLGVSLPPRIDVYILPAAADAPTRRDAPDWAAGYVPYGSTTVVIVRNRLGSYPSWEINGVFVHELTHVLIHTALADRSRELPRWFGEGLAMLQSRRWGFRDAIALSTSLISGTDLPLEKISSGFPEGRRAAQGAYAESFSFLSHLIRKFGEDTPRRILAEIGAGKDFFSAFQSVTGRRIASVEEDWRKSLVWKYRWIPILTANGTLFTGILLLFLLSYAKRRSRNRKILDSWDRQEPIDHF